jgi:hypothetical protein
MKKKKSILSPSALKLFGAAIKARKEYHKDGDLNGIQTRWLAMVMALQKLVSQLEKEEIDLLKEFLERTREVEK